MDSPATRSILLKPVSCKIARLVEDGREFVAQAEDGENGWTVEARQQVLQQLNGEIERAIKKAPKSVAKTTTTTTIAAATTEETAAVAPKEGTQLRRNVS